MIRKIILEGITTGKKIDISDIDKYYLTLPKGFGIKLKNEYLDVGYKRIRIKQTKEWQDISGTIEVVGETRNDWELNFNELRDFVSKNKDGGVRLYYSTIEGQNRYIEADIIELGKTEKNKYCLPTNFVISPTSYWLEDAEVNTQMSGTNIIGKGKGYYETDLDGDWAYSFSYGLKVIGEENFYSYKYDGNAVGEVVLINNGDEICPMTITLNGPCVNPVILLYDSNNNVIQSAKVNYTILADEKIIINSDIDDLFVRAILNDGSIIDLISYIDTNRTTFIELPVGYYTLKVTDSNNDLIEGNIKFSWQYL